MHQFLISIRYVLKILHLWGILDLVHRIQNLDASACDNSKASGIMSTSLPDWLTVRVRSIDTYEKTVQCLRRMGLSTVCESAGCPNIAECFSNSTATFMILGTVCSRNCRFCGVTHGEPMPVSAEEPHRIAQAARIMGLEYVVITSVTRDDLSDGGASQFAKTISSVKKNIPGAKVEVLVPDFNGCLEAVKTVLQVAPYTFGHNVETVPSLYPLVRPGADYYRSLLILETAKRVAPSILTKSGLMVGLGESSREVEDVLRHLWNIGCDIVTIGQYLRPSKANIPVAEYIPPDRFIEYADMAKSLGIRYVMSGPLVRSSYHAAELF